MTLKQHYNDDVRDAIMGLSGIVFGSLVVFISARQLGIISESPFGFGFFADWLIFTVAAIVAICIVSLLVGLAVAKFMMWRYSHRWIQLGNGANQDE